MNEKWKQRAMTPTWLGIIAIIVTAFVWLWRSVWRPWLELVLFFWGVAIGFGGLGIALYKHTLESGKPWGWAALASHWPTGETYESLFWHGWPAALAVGVAMHWWWRFKHWHKEDKNHG